MLWLFIDYEVKNISYMVKLEKWTKGTYYSCKCQTKGNNSCVNCKRERESNRQGFENSFHKPFNCEICHAQLVRLNQDSDAPIESEHIILVECYQDIKERQHEKDSRYACSKCKVKYEKIALCPYCLKDKEDFDNLCCSQCRPGKTPQEIQQKSQGYINSVMSGQNPAQGSDKTTSYLPWVLGGIGIVVVIIGLVWLMRRNNKEEK